ncbi:33981_t:CDS:1, partial [Gigaspora margarita]
YEGSSENEDKIITEYKVDVEKFTLYYELLKRFLPTGTPNIDYRKD